jgi:hypothetical protein
MKKAVMLMVLIVGISVGASAQFRGSKFGGAIPETAVTKTGTIVVQFTINIVTPGLSSGNIGCQAFTVLINNNQTSNYYSQPYAEDDASSEAVISGNTATCSVSVPYSWSVQNPSDYVNVDAGVVADPGISQVVNLSMCSTTTPGTGCVTSFPGRISLKGVSSFTVPGNGVTTVKTVAFHI